MPSTNRFIHFTASQEEEEEKKNCNCINKKEKKKTHFEFSEGFGWVLRVEMRRRE